VLDDRRADDDADAGTDAEIPLRKATDEAPIAV
jgi:hypothetical protein